MKLTFEPAPAWCIVRKLPPGETAGGIIMADNDLMPRLLLVAKSAGHYRNGVLVPCEIPLGSRLITMPNPESGTSPLLPPEHAFLQLHDIVAFEPPQHEVH